VWIAITNAIVTVLVLANHAFDHQHDPAAGEVRQATGLYLAARIPFFLPDCLFSIVFARETKAFGSSYAQT